MQAGTDKTKINTWSPHLTTFIILFSMARNFRMQLQVAVTFRSPTSPAPGDTSFWSPSEPSGRFGAPAVLYEMSGSDRSLREKRGARLFVRARRRRARAGASSSTPYVVGTHMSFASTRGWATVPASGVRLMKNTVAPPGQLHGVRRTACGRPLQGHLRHRWAQRAAVRPCRSARWSGVGEEAELTMASSRRLRPSSPAISSSRRSSKVTL